MRAPWPSAICDGPRHVGGAIRSRPCSRPNWGHTGVPHCRHCRRAKPMPSARTVAVDARSEEHTSELQSHRDLHSFPTRRSSDLAPVFATQLGAYWRPALPALPTGQADAISPHGGGGRGIYWYHTEKEVLGYVPGATGGYQVPVAAIPQLVRCTHTRPCMAQGRSAYEFGKLRPEVRRNPVL